MESRMAKLSPDAAKVRAELEAAVLAEAARSGIEKFNRTKVLEAFKGRAGRSTLFRWVDAVLAGGKVIDHVTGTVKAAAAKRAKREADPAAAAAIEAVSKLPALIKVDDVAGTGAISVIDHLNKCIAVADQVIRYAQNVDGSVRNSKLLLGASEHMRRNLETAAKITQLMMSAERLERFNQAVIEEIAKDSAETAERIAMRLAKLTSQWAA
jgi:hypothetical protein